MPRQGRDLEVLVAKLEEVAAKYPVEIRSPDQIYGYRSQTDREVDVSIRGAVASLELLVIIECRDRAAAQDVTWIEQLATKRDDVKANMAVAVSASGFSASARHMADSFGIELRVLDEISETDVSDWTTMSTFGVSQKSVTVVDTEIYFFQDTPPLTARVAASVERGDSDSLPLVSWPHCQKTNVGEIFDAAKSENPELFASLYDEPATLEVSDSSNPRVGIATQQGYFPLASLKFRCEPASEEAHLPVVRIAEYKTPSGAPTQIVEFGGQVVGGDITISLVRHPDGTTTVAVEGDDDVLGDVSSATLDVEFADGTQHATDTVGPGH